MQLLDVGIQLFSKKRKVRRVMEEMKEAGGNYEAFIEAREKIDAAEAAGKSCTLTKEQTKAMDFVLDRFARTAGRIKRRIRKESKTDAA
jgi:hypothetical protein